MPSSRLWSLRELTFELGLDASVLNRAFRRAGNEIRRHEPTDDEPNRVYRLSEVVALIRADDAARQRLASNSDAKMRAELARAIKLELHNAAVARTLTPTADAEEMAAAVAGMAARHLDAVDMRVKRRHPDLPPAVLDTIKTEISRAQNVLVQQFSDMDEEALLGHPVEREDIESVSLRQDQRYAAADAREARDAPAPGLGPHDVALALDAALDTVPESADNGAPTASPARADEAVPRARPTSEDAHSPALALTDFD